MSKLGGVVKVFRRVIKQSIVIIVLITIINVSYIGNAFAAVSSGTLVNLANASRAQEGLGDLSQSDKLVSAANAKASDMFANQYFAHTSPQGKTPWDFISAAGYNYVYAGENLAIGYNDSSELHNAWMNSPSHRENILNPNFREIGIAAVEGVYEGGQTTIVVEMFGSNSTGQNLATSPNQAVQSESTVSAGQNSHSQEFNLVTSETNFNPQKIFAGDQVTFKAAITGEAQEIYFTVGNQKIDMKEALQSEKNSDKKIFQKKESMTKEGTFTVNITVTDKWGNRDSKDLGKLVVASKVITNPGNGMVGGVRASIKNHWVIYTVSLLTLVSLVTMVLILRKLKLSHKLAKSLATWEF